MVIAVQQGKTMEQRMDELIKSEGYTIKGLKTFKGMEECGGYNCTLYRGKIKVAFFIDDDSGGGVSYNQDNPAEIDRLRESFKTIPLDNTYNISIDCDFSIFLGHMVQAADDLRYWRRLCKNNIIVITKACKDGQYFKYKVTPSKENIASVRASLAKKGEVVEEIVNERY